MGRLVAIRGTDGRTGQPYDTKAFVADPLGEEPQLSAQAWHSANAANRALARLDQASRIIPNPHLLRQPTLRREAQSTSALEGTFAPLEDVFAAELDEDSRRKEGRRSRELHRRCKLRLR
ncbi:Fic/DOC family N-terminal domain-containing protein [Dermacoccaceae bacterium W4C1]